jgi:type I restriction enzyme R subunit
MTEAGYTEAQATAIQKEVELYSEIRSAIKKHSGEELDTKPYEADMRHLLNTYVQADSVKDLGNLGNLTLTELIIKTGMHDAIAQKLNAKGKLSKNAVAESIINNIRITLKRDQLTDPQFYEQMSKLLDDLIAKRRDDSADYEAFLKDAESLVKKISTKHYSAGVPQALQGRPLATVVYNNLPRILTAATPDATADQSAEYGERLVNLALSIDQVMRESAPAGWKGDSAREAQVLNALFTVMNYDRAATEALFELLMNQPGN